MFSTTLLSYILLNKYKILDVNPVSEVIRNNLRQIRYQKILDEGKDITQAEMAELLGMGNNIPQYCNFELQNAQPSLKRVLKFSKILTLPVEKIVYLLEK